MLDDPRTEFDRLKSEWQEGFALSRGFYTSRGLYDLDISRFWNRSWIWAGHESQIAEPGDYMLCEYGPESVIVVRDRDGAVRAHLNVCRHRGSSVCTEAAGHTRVFSCPYHAWTYELSGALRKGQAMGPDFDPSQYGLTPVRVIVFEGLIFICLADTPPPLADGLARLQPLAAPFGLRKLKLAHRRIYPVPANWKLAYENYMECYHCGPAHLDYSRSHSLKDPAAMAPLVAPMQARMAECGLPTETLHLSPVDAPGAEIYWRRYPLFDGYVTGSRNGEPVAPLLGRLTGYDGGTTDMEIGVLNHFLIYSDHMVAYRFVPRDVQKTDIEVLWFVRDDAVEGRDYDPERLCWLWHVTSLDDERIIRHNQQGVNSHRFAPGPLSEMEGSITSFYHSYFARF